MAAPQMNSATILAMLARDHEQKKQRKDSLWNAVLAKRKEVEAARGDEKAVAALTDEYTAMQVAHNEAVVTVQAAREKAALFQAKLEAAQRKKTPEDTAAPGQRIFDALVQKHAPRPLHKEYDTKSVHAAAKEVGGTERECAGVQNLLVASRRRGSEAIFPERPPLPPLRCATDPFVFPKRTVFGVGDCFLHVVDRAVWDVVGRPEDATIVWERDALEAFRKEAFDPRRQVLNRLDVQTELVFSDKSDLIRQLSKPENERYRHGVSIPETVQITTPQEFLAFAQEVGTGNRFDGKWILKRANLASGFGLEVLPNCKQHFTQRNNLAAMMSTMQKSRHKYILQRYIDRPHLLKVDAAGDKVGRKFDWRCYFLVASVDPLVVYWREGTARLNIAEYRDADYGNAHIHISNIAQQRTHRDYAQLQQHLKCTHDGLRKHFPSEEVFDRLTRDMQHAVRQVCHVNRAELLKNAAGSRFQLMACDFLCDADFVLHLLEVQAGPALSYDDPISRVHVPKLVNETLECAHQVLTRRCNGLPLKTLPSFGSWQPLINNSLR